MTLVTPNPPIIRLTLSPPAPPSLTTRDSKPSVIQVMEQISGDFGFRHRHPRTPERVLTSDGWRVLLSLFLPVFFFLDS